MVCVCGLGMCVCCVVCVVYVGVMGACVCDVCGLVCGVCLCLWLGGWVCVWCVCVCVEPSGLQLYKLPDICSFPRHLLVACLFRPFYFRYVAH